MEILVGGRAKRFQGEIVDDQERHAGKGGEFPVVAADGARGVETCGERGASGEHDIDALAHGAVSEGLCKTALAGAAGSDDEHGGALAHVACAPR